MGFKIEKKQEQLISGFFLLFAPLFSFIIFSDEWCDYYNVDMEETSDLFADAFGKMYSVLARENIQTTNLEEILKRKP